ncbi:MAG: GAF domain-containing sensor histidine kinase [Gemmatimonadetes bacterium]|nr:GAF domain-containing sensor histidine kinase [Gemmatimonadota bacterium]
MTRRPPRAGKTEGPVRASMQTHAESRLELLVRASLRIHGEHTLERVLQTVADTAREVIGAKYAALGVLDATGQGLSNFVASGLSLEQHAKIGTLPRGLGVLGLLIREPKPLRLQNISAHPKAHGFPAHHPVMHSFLGVPIIGHGGPFGNLYLTEKIGADQFSIEDEAIAMMLAAQAAVAVENARLHDESTRLLSEVRSMQASRDRFFAMINHEMRNALTAVYGWADLLVRKAGDTLPRAAREVYESAERTLALLNDLLDLSRLEAARLKPVIRAADAWELVREATQTVEPAARARGIEIASHGPDRALPCHTDPQRVRQILVNLLSNAVRHSPDKGLVEVQVEVTESRMQYEIVDHGEGIAPEQQQSIFEAFVQADSDRERGTGLGLTLSRQLARLLGGDLTVQSRVGAGARFSLDIPRHSPVS